jgi:hypothetical protein
VPADTARPLGDLAVHLPDTGILRLLLIKDDTVLAENAYDLTYEDRHRVGPAAALRHWLTWHLFLNVLR